MLATVSVGALAMATVPAMARDATAAPQQPAASQTKYDGDAIVVTGITQQDANIQDTPIAITAFSGETLTEQGIGKVGEIATFTPGFNIREAGNNPTALTLALRGPVPHATNATHTATGRTCPDTIYTTPTQGPNTKP